MSACIVTTFQSSLSQKVLKKLGKKRQKSIPNHSLERWPSNQQININGVDNRNSKADLPHQPFRGRSKTFTDGGNFLSLPVIT